MEAQTFNPSTQEGEAADLYEIKASLVNRPAGATKRLLHKNQNQTKPNQQKIQNKNEQRNKNLPNNKHSFVSAY